MVKNIKSTVILLFCLEIPFAFETVSTLCAPSFVCCTSISKVEVFGFISAGTYKAVYIEAKFTIMNMNIVKELKYNKNFNDYCKVNYNIHAYMKILNR